MKKKYMKPTQRVIVLQHRTHLLQASPTATPPETKEYDDWLGYAPGIGKGGNHLA